MFSKTNNLKGFRSGNEWNGNRNGRPKKIYLRDDFTDEIFQERKEDIRVVTERLFLNAKLDKPWAIKLVMEYFLTRPKNKQDPDQIANDNDIVDKLKSLPSSKLITIQRMLIEEIEKE